MTKISVSILNCDYLDLDNKIKECKAAGADMLHLDVMDGHFVPNISFGVPVIDAIKKHTDMPLDVHLMISDPDSYIESFAKYADYLGFHYEANGDTLKILKKIKDLGVRTVLTIKPKTDAKEIFEFLPYCDMVLVMSVEPGFGGQKFMMNAVNKIKALRQEIDILGLNTEIEVDGGINGETGKLCADAGATVLVAGSYIVGANDINTAVQSLKL